MQHYLFDLIIKDTSGEKYCFDDVERILLQEDLDDHEAVEVITNLIKEGGFVHYLGEASYWFSPRNIGQFEVRKLRAIQG